MPSVAECARGSIWAFLPGLVVGNPCPQRRRRAWALPRQSVLRSSSTPTDVRPPLGGRLSNRPSSTVPACTAARPFPNRPRSAFPPPSLSTLSFSLADALPLFSPALRNPRLASSTHHRPVPRPSQADCRLVSLRPRCLLRARRHPAHRATSSELPAAPRRLSSFSSPTQPPLAACRRGVDPSPGHNGDAAPLLNGRDGFASRSPCCRHNGQHKRRRIFALALGLQRRFHKPSKWPS